MLKEQGVAFEARDYTKQPLDEDELREVLAALGVPARDVLRTRDPAYKAAGLTGDEDDDTLIALMAEHPTLLQRPIGMRGGKAVVGRPVENLLSLQ